MSGKYMKKVSIKVDKRLDNICIKFGCDKC